VENAIFLGGKTRGALGQPAYFLAENCMTTVAFEKSDGCHAAKVFEKLSLFSKTVHFDGSEV